MKFLHGVFSLIEFLGFSRLELDKKVGRRSFNFEEFRRAHSARLQTERLRVAVPPDHFPLWPIRK
ncbi:unnamed protein product [Effrenium voratum]|nr:unnamed protein product [Effrenium voratum]